MRTLTSIKIDFNDGREPQKPFLLLEKIIEDRGSMYSVSMGSVHNREDIKAFLKQLKSNKKYLKATHNSWATRISRDGGIFESKNDDGETGAGMIILRCMQKEKMCNCIICVTRWFGGIKLMGDRFKHIQDATKYILEKDLKEIRSY